MPNVTNADTVNDSDAVKAQLAFLTWVRKTYPGVYSQAIYQATGQPMGGILDSISSAIGKINFSSLADGIAKAGTAVLAIKGQKDILKLNLARAKAGEAPIDPSTMYTSPTVRTEIDVDPVLAARLRESANASLPWLIGGAALLAVVLLRKRR